MSFTAKRLFVLPSETPKQTAPLIYYLYHCQNPTPSLITNHFSGPESAVGPVCVCLCVCVRTISSERNYFSSRYLAHSGSPYSGLSWSYLWWNSKVDDTGQISRSQDEKNALFSSVARAFLVVCRVLCTKLFGATSSEDLRIRTSTGVCNCSHQPAGRTFNESTRAHNIQYTLRFPKILLGDL